MMQELDLLMVNPGNRSQLYGKLGSKISGIAPPLGIGLIAAFVRKYGHSVEIIDAEAKNYSPKDTADKIARCNPTLVGVSAYTTKMTAAGELLTALKKKAPHITTILGGSHPSSLPERTLKEEAADFICIGEGFYPVLQLLEVLKAGKDPKSQKINGLGYLQDGVAVLNPMAPLVKEIDRELPFVAWDLLPMDEYRAHHWQCFGNLKRRKPYVVMYTSLGCPYNCSYCSVNAVYGKSGFRFRSPENVVAEIDFLVKNYKILNIEVVDDTFTVQKDRVMRICDLIIQGGYNLNIWCYARVDTISEQMLKKMKQAGFNWICFGIEAGNPKVRDGVLKGFDKNTIQEAMEMTWAAGINILGNFMFGLPDDNHETMRATLDMAKSFNFEHANFYAAMAYPGSKLYHDAVEQGMKLPEHWHGYGQYAEDALPMSTKYLSGSEVLRFRDNAFVEYFSNPRYLEMITKKFDPEAAEYTKEILKRKIHRKYA